MNALIWKKINELKRRKIKFLIIVILPYVYLAATVYLNIKIESTLSIFPLITALLYSLIFFSVEDIISSEVLLATSISIKDFWIFNIGFVNVISFVYSLFALIVSLTIIKISNIVEFNLNIQSILSCFICIIISISLIGFSTIHFSTNSKIKQLIASGGALINILIPILYLIFGNKIDISVYFLLIAVFVSSIFFSILYLIMLKSDNEMLLYNSKKLLTLYENTIDE